MSSARAFSTPERLVAIQAKAANGRVLRALLSLVSAALLLRVGGMVNQVVVSASFGAGPAMDAYFAAVAFPLLLVQLLGSALEAAIIPVYSRLRIHSAEETASRLLSTLVNGLLLGALLLTIVLLALRQSLVFLLAPGFDEMRLSQAVALTPLLYLVVPLSLLVSLLECLLNAEGQFGWPAYAGLLVPLTTAFLVLIVGRSSGIIILCFGALVGTVLQLAVVVVRAKLARIRYRLILDVHHPDLRAILSSAWPVLVGAFIIQGSPLIDQIFASTLPTGSVSALNYALKLVSVFIGVLFVSVGRAVFPYLARQAALHEPDYRTLKSTLHLYVWGTVCCSFVLSLLLLFLGQPLIQLLFQHGAFSAFETQKTAIILSGFAPGLVPMALGFLLSRTFNALGETRIPMYMALVNIGANAFFDALFAHFWQGLGIALATSAVSWLSSLLLLALLSRRIGSFQVWRVPPEIRACVAYMKHSRTEKSHASSERWFRRYFYADSLRQGLCYIALMLLALLTGAIATTHNALVTLRAGIGALLVLCFLRYPFILVLIWASFNVCIGSSLALFNGNNLDTLLILPLLGLLVVLPWKEMIRRMPGVVWLALFLGWVFIGIGVSPLDTTAFLILWLTMLASIGTAILTIALVTTRQRFLVLVSVLLATAFLVALYGLYGFVTHQRGEVDADTLLFRITSLFTQATTFAFYLSSLLPLAFYGCLSTRGVWRLVNMLVLLCLLAALLLTFTRSASIGAFLQALIMALCLPTRRTRALIVGGLIFFFGGAFYLAWSGHLPLLARFFQGDSATLNGRVYLWLALLSNFQVTCWLGQGLQSSDRLLAYLRVGNAGQGVIGTAPHSLFLGTLYDHGVIGLFLLTMAFLTLGSCLFRGIWKYKGERRMLYAVALASLVSILIQSLGSRDLWIQSAGVSFWIVLALPLARCWPDNEVSVPKTRRSDGWLNARSPPCFGQYPLGQIKKHVEGEV